MGYDGKAVGGFLKDGLGSLVFNGGSDSQYVEWIKKSDDSKVEMNFAFRLKQNVSTLALNFDKATYVFYSPETVTCYAQFERHSDISKSVSVSAVIPTDVDSLEMNLGFIAHNVHCEMFYRTSEQSIRLKSVKFDSSENLLFVPFPNIFWCESKTIHSSRSCQCHVFKSLRCTKFVVECVQ